MRTFYVYNVKDFVYSLYEKYPYQLYKMLEDAYLTNKYDMVLSSSYYGQITNNFNKLFMNHYIMANHKLNGYYYKKDNTHVITSNQEYSKLETLEDSIKEELVDAICHGIVVSNLSALLSRELGEDEEFCNQIAIAGLLHDIGKIKMNRYLYGKDALAVEEMKYFRMHSVYSYDVLHKLGYSRIVQESVFHHHENYDGSGYPDNLVGKDIPYGARILHVCDVFAALTSNRSYRAAFDQEAAVEVMLEETKNFDIEIFPDGTERKY